MGVKLGSFDRDRAGEVAPDPGGSPRTVLRYALAAAVALLIAYGSLYPFDFRDAGSLSADISHFLASWRQPPESRGDLIANLLLYAPLGLAATLAFAQGMSRALAFVLAVLCGASLSLFVELTQFYDAGRVSAFADFYLNVASTVGGAVLALTAGAQLVRTSWPHGGSPAFARLLLLAWLGYRLYPYVPTLEIHKYWRSLQPVLFAPPLNAHDLFRYTAMWLSVIFLFRTGLQRSTSLLLMAMLGFFAAKASIIGQVLTLPELLGAALAFLLSLLILDRFASLAAPFTGGVLLLDVIFARVLPWQFAAVPKPFGWIPFYSFLHGSLLVDTISFAEKFYLYGAVILLLVRSGLGLWLAVLLECAILFGTSWLETYMVGRSAEISDAVLALILGLIYAYFRHQYREDAKRPFRAAPRTAQAGNESDSISP